MALSIPTDGGYAISYDNIYFINGARTPFGRFSGTLGTVSPTDLGIASSLAALERAGVSAGDIDQVIFANIIQSSVDAIYLPRHIALYCGVRHSVPALMVQRICGSGFESIIVAAEQITLGKAHLALTGGAENMTLSPTSSFGNRLGYRFGSPGFVDMLWEGLQDPAAGCSMGQTAENLAKAYNISREEVDEYALRCHTLAAAAVENGRFAEEIVPMASGVHEGEGLSKRKVMLNPRKATLSADEHMRPTTADSLAALRASFGADGVQTAGNSSGIVDGAASAIIGSAAAVKDKGLKPLARVAASASAGVDPKYMGIGPVPAIWKLLEHTGLTIDDIGLFEINEAFGAQIIAVERELELDRDKLNVNGSSIAIGHPLAATGTRLTHTLAIELKKRGVKYGIASACIGGGQGTAILLQNEEV